MKKKKGLVCFSFWLPEKDAESLRTAAQQFREKNNRKIGVGEIVWPSIKSFIGRKK